MACVLVVEDDPSLLSFVRDVLVEEGHEVHTARNGRDALEHLRLMRPAGPDAILLDMNTPVMSGWGFADAYRRCDVPPPRAAVIVMSAALDARATCREIGGDDCLAKPFDLTELLDMVDRHSQRAA